jgi:LmbE family N-acetylglucosaminyl deacetylase
VYHYIQDHFIEPDFVIDITPFMDKKMESIMAYSSQFFDPNSKEPETPISSKNFMEYVKAKVAYLEELLIVIMLKVLQ